MLFQVDLFSLNSLFWSEYIVSIISLSIHIPENIGLECDILVKIIQVIPT